MDVLGRMLTRLASGRGRGLASASLRRLLRVLAAHPERVLAFFGEEPIRSDTGAELDRQVQLLLVLGRRFSHPDVDALTPEAARAQLRMDAAIVAPEPASLAECEDIAVSGPAGALPARVYRASSEPMQPALVYFHGGGWVVGDLETHDAACRAVAQRARASVIAVDYRLAPEAPFPAAVLDCEAAFHAVRERALELRLDPARLGVAGDSAGGSLAAVVCRRARDAGAPTPALAVLTYPGADMTLSRRSHQTFERGFFLERAQIEWYRSRYVSPEDWRHPDASPLFAESLAGMPRTLVVTAGFDPLRDEGHDYAKRLEEAGVDVSYRCFDSLVHGFIVMAGASQAAARARDEIADWVRDAFAALSP